MGGVGFKTGLVQRAEDNAAKYAALAIQLRGPDSVTQPRSPQVEHYAQLARQYRRFGGVAYKAGLVQRAEAEQRKYEPAAGADIATTQDHDDSCRWSKPVVCFLARTR